VQMTKYNQYGSYSFWHLQILTTINGGCVACPKGTFNQGVAATQCESCLEGYTTASVGSTGSDKCEAIPQEPVTEPVEEEQTTGTSSDEAASSTPTPTIQAATNSLSGSMPSGLEGKLAAKFERAKRTQMEAATCTQASKPFYCGDSDYVLSGLRNGCASSPGACIDSSKRAAYDSAVEDSTSEDSTPITVRQCVNGMKRCESGSCAAEDSVCSGTSPCAAETAVSCGDGVTCKSTKEECRETVKLFGCEPGMVRCHGIRFSCAESKEACAAQTGCADSTHEVCGFSRDADGTSSTPICKASCDTKPSWNSKVIAAAPSLERSTLASTSIDTAIVDEDSESQTRVRFSAVAASFKVKDDAPACDSESGCLSTFTVGQMSDTDLVNGVFSTHVSGNKLRSVAIDIEPPSELELETGQSFDLEFDVNDEDIDGDPVKCTAALAKMVVLSASSATASTFKVEGACKESSLSTEGSCYCKKSLSHFSVYTVIEGAEATEGSIRLGSGRIHIGSGRIRFQASEL